VIAGLLILIIGVLSQFSPPPSFDHPRSTPLAVWVGVEWSMEAHTDAEIAALATDLTMRGVDHAYVYVSYLKPGDFFNPTFDHAATFTERFRDHAPEIHLWAWIGVPISVTQPDGSRVENRLTDPEIRNQIAVFSAMTIDELGFDGVHLNAELIPNDDPAFLATLSAIRLALPPDTPLSTTAHALRLTKSVTMIPYPTIRHHGSSDYLREVARLSDQVVLMMYDSGLISPADYRQWSSYQVQASTEALGDLEVEFLIGISVSEEITPSHSVAESLANGLAGLQAGLAQSSAPQAFDGIALYPYWEMSADEWDLLNSP
jgi:hypothetical protein